MPSPADIVNLTADALAGVIEANPGRLVDPGADLAVAPSVGIGPGFPWAEWRTLGREMTMNWQVRILVGPWADTGPALEAARCCWRDASPLLRAAGYNVGPLDPPSTVTLGNVPHLLVAFNVTYPTKE